MTYLAQYPAPHQQLEGFWSSVKKVGKTVGKVVATPVTLAVKTTTSAAKVVGIPGADYADRLVDKVSIKPLNNLVDKVTDTTTDLACKALMNQYISTGITIGLTVYTGGSGLVIAQGAKAVASGKCAQRMAQAMATAPPGTPGITPALQQSAQAALQQSAQAASVQTAPGYPTGTIAVRQRDGTYRIAVPRGLGDVGAPTHLEIAIEAGKPATAQEVDKSTYDRATKPFYARTPFLVGAGLVGALAVTGTVVAVRRRRR